MPRAMLCCVVRLQFRLQIPHPVMSVLRVRADELDTSYNLLLLTLSGHSSAAITRYATSATGLNSILWKAVTSF
jgi:hypothetical protein